MMLKISIFCSDHPLVASFNGLFLGDVWPRRPHALSLLNSHVFMPPRVLQQSSNHIERDSR